MVTHTGLNDIIGYSKFIPKVVLINTNKTNLFPVWAIFVSRLVSLFSII